VQKLEEEVLDKYSECKEEKGLEKKKEEEN